MSSLKEQSDFIYNVIEYLWLVSIFFIIYFFIGNSCYMMKNQYHIDITSSGLNQFILLNEHIFKIPIFSAAITTGLLGWITVKIYLHTYFTTHENNINNQDVNRYSTYLQHYNNFIMMIDNGIERSEYLSNNTIDKFALYNFIYPDAPDGNLTISENYKNIIKEIDVNIIFLNTNLPRKIGYSDHIQRLIIQSSLMGIQLPEYERKDFLRLEHDFYFFINHINKNIKLNSLSKPAYSVYSAN